jgi:RNA polymerase sigma factor (sigma-70 family)
MTNPPTLRATAPPRRRRGSGSTTSGLLRRCREGDNEAWAELVGSYERLVFRVACKEGLGADDAADVTQIVFESLLTALPNLRDDERLSAWLFSVARRQAWRVRDRGHRERPASPLVEDEAVPPVAATDDDWSSQVERSLCLRKALRDLGEPCRSLLLALYLDSTYPSHARLK